MKIYETHSDLKRDKILQKIEKLRDRQILFALFGGIIGLFGVDHKDIKSRFLLITGCTSIATSLFFLKKITKYNKKLDSIGPQEIILPEGSKLDDLPNIGNNTKLYWQNSIKDSIKQNEIECRLR